MKQPVLGIVWTIVALIIGGGAYYIGVDVMKMDQVDFMVEVPIPFIFGTIFVLNMLQGSLFAKFTQPLKGVFNTVAAAVLGNLFALMYRALAQTLSWKTRTRAPPAYQTEIWLASALLSVTFPFLVAYADFFTMWPLQRAKAERVWKPPAGADFRRCVRRRGRHAPVRAGPAIAAAAGLQHTRTRGRRGRRQRSLRRAAGGTAPRITER